MTHSQSSHRPAGAPNVDSAPLGGRRRRVTWLIGWLIVGLIVAVSLGYLARRALAKEALEAWLDARGVEAHTSFRALGPRGLSGALRIGPEQNPILSTDRAELSYRITGPWAGRALGLELDRIELFEPSILVRWTPDGPSLGALDPLIAEFRSRPSRPDAPSPEIIIHDGLIRLEHAAGSARIHADARMRRGVLVALSGRMEPTRLRLDDLSLDLDDVRLGLVTRDGRTSASLAGGVKSGRLGAASVGAGSLSLAVSLPYPQASSPLGEGDVTVAATLRAAGLEGGGSGAAAVEATGSFRGRATGGLQALSLTGQATLRADAEDGRGGDIRYDSLSVSVQSRELNWRRSPEQSLAGDVRLSLIGQHLEGGDLNLTRVAADLSGVIGGGATTTVDLRGPIRLTGGWTGFGDVSVDDADAVSAIKHGARAFSLTAPAVGLKYDGEAGPQLALYEPARLVTASGGRAILSARGGAEIYANGRGAFDLQVRDGGLPRVDASVTNYGPEVGGVGAETHLSVETDLGPMRGLSAKAAGRLTWDEGRITFRAAACAPIDIDRFESGETSVEDIRLNLCPGARPLLSGQGGEWTLAGRARQASASAPFLQATLENGQADLVFGSGASGMYASATVNGGRLVDATDNPRFNPLDVTGTIVLADEAWRGDLSLAANGTPLGKVGIVHEGVSGQGAVEIDTGRLEFAEDGLQPVDLSPLASALGSPAFGAAQFTGQFRWAPDGGGSAGRLSVFELDFASPAGAVRGLSGDLDFTSLAPLETAEGQRLAAQELQILAPLSAPQMTFQLLGRSLEISEGQVKVGGGIVRIEPMSVPFDSGESWKGELVVEAVQLADIVRSTPFSDRVSLSARVSGRLPFIVGPDGFRLVQGRLEAIEPGRLSIRRAALTDVSASGGGASAAVDGLVDAAPVAPVGETNTAVEFAYQAMEHLAFDLLDAEVNSLPGGRLGVLFHVRGEHSPPQRQEIRLTLGQLIRRDFLKRELPLPSGTKVDLTLDTSLNLDQLLADYAEAQAARGSGEVQLPEPD